MTTDHGPQRQPASEYRIYCIECGKSVSTVIPDDAVFRAVATCPECIESHWPESTAEEAAMLRKELAGLNLERCSLNHELAHLRAENERIRAALEQFANRDNWYTSHMHQEWIGQSREPWQLASDALRGEGERESTS